ncbi:hypothetical protein ACQ4PT_068836 [Festuca glaucescens]
MAWSWCKTQARGAAVRVGGSELQEKERNHQNYYRLRLADELGGIEVEVSWFRPEERKWEEVTELPGRVVFLGTVAVLARVALLEVRENCIYFARRDVDMIVPKAICVPWMKFMFAQPDDQGTAAAPTPRHLLTTTEPEHQVKGRLLLDVVVSKGPAVLQLLAGKDEALLVWRDALLILDLGLDVVDGVRRLHLKGDGLVSEGLDEDLHATPKTQDKVKGGLLLDVVVSKGLAVLQLFASKDEALLVRGDALLVLDLCLHVVNGGRGLHLKGDSLAGQSLHKDLHLQRTVNQIGW